LLRYEERSLSGSLLIHDAARNTRNAGDFLPPNHSCSTGGTVPTARSKILFSFFIGKKFPACGALRQRREDPPPAT